MNMRNILSGK